MPLRLNRLQVALALFAVALFVAAIAVLVAPRSAPAGTLPGRGEPPAPPAVFDPPLPVLAADPETPLVERNPFDPARRPPARRWSAAAAAAAEAEAAFQAQPVDPGFALLGTVIVPGGRNMAVLRVMPLHPTGATFHVGDEPLPGWRVTWIGRDRATLVGNGQRLELEIESPNPSPGVLP